MASEKVIASTTLLWNDVKTTSTPSATNGTNTNFRFKDPVYLSPSTEYAFVVLSESPAYKIWYSSLGETDISSQTRIDQQPYAGSMFRSQNGSTWTPYQNDDIMFVINKAVFSTSQAVVTFRAQSKNLPINMDEVLLQSTDVKFPATDLRYNLQTTYRYSLAPDSGNDILPGKLFKIGRAHV